MNSKIWISNIFDLFFLNHTVHCMHAVVEEGEAARQNDHEISAVLARKSYLNINFDQIKNMDINLMIINLTFH